MAVLIVLVVTTLLARLAGRTGIKALRSWPAAVRVGLAVMLFFTGAAHFNSLRFDMAAMMPPGIPNPMAVVYFTGVCEILGGLGLLIPRVRMAAAAALIVFFLAVLPANIHAARSGVALRGRPATPLVVRIPMQGLFIALTWWAGIHRRRD